MTFYKYILRVTFKNEKPDHILCLQPKYEAGNNFISFMGAYKEAAYPGSTDPTYLA